MTPALKEAINKIYPLEEHPLVDYLIKEIEFQVEEKDKVIKLYIDYIKQTEEH